MAVVRAIQKLTGPLQRRVRLMVGRAVIKLVSDAAKVQGLQVSLLEGEVRDGVERFQQYGFSSVPLAGCEAVMVCVGGNRDHGIVIATEDRRYRVVGLPGGAVAIYTHEDQQAGGHKIVLKEGRLIDVDCDILTVNATTKAVFNTPLLQVNDGDVKADTISLKHHVHNGVQTGAGNTGLPVP